MGKYRSQFRTGDVGNVPYVIISAYYWAGNYGDLSGI